MRSKAESWKGPKRKVRSLRIKEIAAGWMGRQALREIRRAEVELLDGVWEWEAGIGNVPQISALDD